MFGVSFASSNYVCHSTVIVVMFFWYMSIAVLFFREWHTIFFSVTDDGTFVGNS